MGERSWGKVCPWAERPSQGPKDSSGVGGWQNSQKVAGGFVLANNLQLRGKIQLDQILHSPTDYKTYVILLQSIPIYMAITEQNYKSQWRKQKWAELNQGEKNLAASTVLEISCFYNQDEVMLKVTLKHYPTTCTGEIALGLSSGHQSHLYGPYTLTIILLEQPFTFPMWKYVDAEAKWENMWRKNREFQAVRNSCLNQWRFPHAGTVTWYKETHICKWTCSPCIPGTRNYLYWIVLFQLLAFSAKVWRSARWHVVMLFPKNIICSLAWCPSVPSHKNTSTKTHVFNRPMLYFWFAPFQSYSELI